MSLWIGSKLVRWAITGAVLVAAMSTAACLSQPTLVTCEDSTACPSAYECYLGQCIQPDVCGNGRVESNEQCDGDDPARDIRCSATCRIEECGNNVIDPGEECDDGNASGGDGCNSLCAAEVCGNSTVDAGEECDDGDRVPGDGCSEQCRLEACGNGFADPGEGCDDGNRVGDDGCSVLCQPEVCGNAVLDPGEQCDCGTEGAAPRDGACRARQNDVLGGYCRSDCRHHCGDGALASEEVCDSSITITEQCSRRGFDYGHVQCSASCDAVIQTGCGIWGWQPVQMTSYVDIYGLWGSRSDNVFGVGDNGAIRRFDGESWHTVISPTSKMLKAIWGRSSDDIVAVGHAGAILHFDGQAWYEVESEQTGTLRDIWGDGADLFVIGDGGTILRHDGAGWSSMASPILDDFVAIWGISATEIYAASAQGELLAYDGQSWEQIAVLPEALDIRDIWASASDDIYIVAGRGFFEEQKVFRYDGNVWHVVLETDFEPLIAIWGTSGDNVYVLSYGEGVWHYDGGFWAFSKLEPGAPRGVLWGLSDNEIFVMSTAFGEDSFRYDGHSYRQITDSTLGSVVDIWSSRGEEVFAVSSSGFGGGSESYFSRLSHDGRDWQTESQGLSRMPLGIWGSGSNNVFVVGRDGLVARFDGISLTPMTVPTQGDLSDIWGSSPERVFVVGDDATILSWDGSEWALMSVPTTEGLNGVWGSGPNDVFAVGDVSTILHYDGLSWTKMPAPRENVFLTAIWGVARDDVYAVGIVGLSGSPFGIVFHYDGEAWNEVLLEVDVGFSAIGGSSSDDVFIVGGNPVDSFAQGVIHHYDGVSWAPVTGTGVERLLAVWSLSRKRTLFGGYSDGLLYRH